MPQVQSIPTPAAATSAPAHRGATREITRTVARWTNRIVLAATIAQFYTAGLAVFGAASFRMHNVTGRFMVLASLGTMTLLLVARVPFRVSRFAIGILVLALLQPVLAFGTRATAPSLSALHPLNGLALVALAVLLDRRIRNGADQLAQTLSSPTSRR